jgi:hypothetical protein
MSNRSDFRNRPAVPTYDNGESSLGFTDALREVCLDVANRARALTRSGLRHEAIMT